MITWPTRTGLALATPALAEKTTGQVVDDSTIATETRVALIGQDKLSAGSINVEVNKGPAHQIKGMQQVRNLIAVTH